MEPRKNVLIVFASAFDGARAAFADVSKEVDAIVAAGCAGTCEEKLLFYELALGDLSSKLKELALVKGAKKRVEDKRHG